MGDAAVGKTLFASTCANCHGGTGGVSKAGTLTGLNTAMQRSVHNSFSGDLTEQDKLDLAAYIAGN